MLKARSPIHHTGNFNSPTLLIRSKEDGVVDIEHFKKIKKRLKKADIPVYIKEIEKSDHHFSKSQGRRVLYSEITKFLEKHFPARKNK